MKQILILFFTLGSLSLFSQTDWPKPTVKKYPEKGTKNHQMDYVYLDVANWEGYCAGDKTLTNSEIPAQVTYYNEKNEKVFSSAVGIRLSGFWIRKLPQKSISVKFSNKLFGSEKLNYPLFLNRDYDKIDDFVIRAHGNPLNKTYFKDAMMNVALDEYTDLEYSSYRPIALYVNGEYYGLYNLREKKDKDYVKNLHGISKSDIELFDLNGGENLEPNADWEALHEYFKNNEVNSKSNYEYVSSKIDVDNFIDYHIAHIFYANTDWPKANVKVWRVKGGKWRWMFFDCDRGFLPSSVKFNALEHISGVDQWAIKREEDNRKVDIRLENASLWFRKLIQNEEFKLKFIKRYQDLLNTSFATDRMNEQIDLAVARIDSELDQQINRWRQEDKANAYQYIENRQQWEKHVNQMRSFTENKPDAERKFLDEKFDLGGFESVSILNKNMEGGYFKINSVTWKYDYFRGKFFNDLKITVIAIPNEGYEFDGWEGYNSKQEKITFFPKDLKEGLKVNFKKK